MITGYEITNVEQIFECSCLYSASYCCSVTGRHANNLGTSLGKRSFHPSGFTLPSHNVTDYCLICWRFLFALFLVYNAHMNLENEIYQYGNPISSGAGMCACMCVFSSETQIWLTLVLYNFMSYVILYNLWVMLVYLSFFFSLSLLCVCMYIHTTYLYTYVCI